MPTVSRSRVVAAIPEHVWDVVANPERLTEWWPNVQRVEESDGKAWTTVLASPKGGKLLRADFSLVASEHPRRRSWRHEVAASPFEHVLTNSVTDIRLEPAAGGRTEVRISEQMGLRGFSRLGGGQVKRAARRKLDRALDGLESLFA
ncbi:MAG TPA: SRPBCC family protein [Thermoleophilaceae bacterium]|nr:SRPBCC family protein [Thermoleophilaceae bacterium]